MTTNHRVIILVSANAEWRAIKQYFGEIPYQQSPYGEWFSIDTYKNMGIERPVIFLHGGWGKVAAAGSTQYAISRWQPDLLINIGTCGGLQGEVQRGDVILADKTIIYDIYEQMGDSDEHIKKYSTELDLSWLRMPLPMPVKRSLLVSADRDLLCNEIQMLKQKYRAVAGDWESGAIAWVANKNHTKCLILRGVTDLVSETMGEAYADERLYHEQAKLVMTKLLDTLPAWLSKCFHL